MKLAEQHFHTGLNNIYMPAAYFKVLTAIALNLIRQCEMADKNNFTYPQGQAYLLHPKIHIQTSVT